MKVLVQNDQLGSPAIAFGFTLLGEDVVLWNPSEMKAFEVFRKFKPNIYVGPSSGLTPAILRARGDAVLALWDDGVDIEKPERSFVYSENEIPWPYIGGDAQKNHLLGADVLLLGDYDATLNSFLAPVFEQDYVSRAYGRSTWPVPYYGGEIDMEETDSAIASSKIVLLWGRIKNTRWVMRAVRLGSLPILVGEPIPGCPLPGNKDPESLMSSIDRCVKNYGERAPTIASIEEWALLKRPHEVAQAIIKASFLC